MPSAGRGTMEAVSSRRPGRSYARQNAERATTEDWGKIDYPGGRALWCRLVIGFTIVTLVGSLFVIVGAVFLQEAVAIHEENGISLAVIWCIIGIVCGSLLMISGIVIGRMIISDKWRKNQQPHYGRAGRNRARVESETSMRLRSSTDGSAGRPPPYSGSDQPSPPTAVFIISGGDVSLALPVIAREAFQPPSYDDITPAAPPGYAIDDPCKPPLYGELMLHQNIANADTSHATIGPAEGFNSNVTDAPESCVDTLANQ